MPTITDYSKFEDNYSSNKKWGLSFFIKIILLSLLIAFFINIFIGDNRNTTDFINPLAESIIQKGNQILNPETNSINLENIIQKELNNADGDYAVAIKNLKTGERYLYNENNIFETASLYKLFVMTEAFEQITSGDLDPDQLLSQEIPILNKKFGIATESAELTEGSISIKVNDAITKMITISDNYSALLISEKVGISKVSKFLETNDFNTTKMGTLTNAPTTTASDMLKFFENLYESEVAVSNNTKAMLTLLKNQQLNSKLPKYLPENIEIAHKTGELGRLSHDAGIVFTPKGDYVIVILTETSKPIDANEKISVISKNVYEYFNN